MCGVSFSSGCVRLRSESLSLGCVRLCGRTAHLGCEAVTVVRTRTHHEGVSVAKGLCSGAYATDMPCPGDLRENLHLKI